MASLMLIAAPMAKAQTASPDDLHEQAQTPAFDLTIQTQNETDNTADEYRLEMPEFSKEVRDIVSPAADDGQKYYRNFLGEKCLDLGTGKMYYDWKRDMTYAGIPIFLSSFIIKGQKKAFRSARFEFEKNFKSEIDNYTQFAPYLLVAGLKLGGYEGRSDWPRFLTSTLLSNAVMATFVNATKYSVKEMRPDNSTRNSFPSGHTATAFVAATVLHKEYGLTRSPWFSVGGYTVATATGIMRVLNNRHWISDVVAGAGIGLLSTELGYFIGDVIWKNRGIVRQEMSLYTDPNHPSFFDIQMGVGLHPDRIDFQYDNEGVVDDYVKLGTSTVFGVEGAYFFNRHIGVGGMARVTSTPSRDLNITDGERQKVSEINQMLSSYQYFNPQAGKETSLPGIYNMYVDNNNFIDASLDAGLYLNFPLSESFSIGTKALLGARLTGSVSYKARNGRPSVAGTFTLADGTSGNLYWFKDATGDRFISSVHLDKDMEHYNYVLEDETDEYDLMKIKGNKSINFVTGVNLTWRYKENFAWKVFADFDLSKNKYTYTGRALSDEAMGYIMNTNFIIDHPAKWGMLCEEITGHASRFMNFISIGGAFTVTF